MAEQNRAKLNPNRPRLRTLEATDEERHASWFELFFDLVFVLAVSKIAQILAGNSDFYGMAKFIALFIPVWWTWNGFTFYADRFENDDKVYRVLMFAAMFAVSTLALCLGGAFTAEGDTAFVVCYVVVRIILIALYLRSAYHIPVARSLCFGYIKGFAPAAVLWLVSLFVPLPFRYAIWAISILVELVTPIFNTRQIRMIPFDQSHIPERFGLFTIIVLGEAVVATANGVSQNDWNFSTISMAAIGFAMAAAVWWINFDFVEDNAIKSQKTTARFIYLYANFFIVSSIVALGIGVEHAIKETFEPHLHTPTLMLFGISIAVLSAAITVVKLAAENCNLFYARIGAIFVSLALIFAGQFLPPIVTMLLFFGLLAAGVWLETNYDELSGEVTDAITPCEHQDEMKIYTPNSTDGCEECVKNNYKWVHLRLCLSCGHVGCCNSSVYNHAEKHSHAENHPIIASLEADENWAYCYVDERFVPLLKTIENQENKT
ncbi:MAG: low temperature requirement protein A [Pyrinomonadaceae bacterium]